MRDTVPRHLGCPTAFRSEEVDPVAKVTMPQLGESVAEGTIGKWLKKPGDHVAKYEPLLEVITDKVNAEVPSPFEGILSEILVEEGATVPNNAEIAVIEDGRGAAADASNGAGATAAATAADSGDRRGRGDRRGSGRGRSGDRRSGRADVVLRPAAEPDASPRPPPRLPLRRRRWPRARRRPTDQQAPMSEDRRSWPATRMPA